LKLLLLKLPRGGASTASGFETYGFSLIRRTLFHFEIIIIAYLCPEM